MLAVIIKVPSGTYHEIFQMLSAAAPTFQKFLKSFFSLEQLHPTLKFKFQVPILTITVQCILYHSIHTPIPSNHSLYPNSLCHPTSILLPDSSLACTDLSRITYLLKKQKQNRPTKQKLQYFSPTQLKSLIPASKMLNIVLSFLTIQSNQTALGHVSHICLCSHSCRAFLSPPTPSFKCPSDCPEAR